MSTTSYVLALDVGTTTVRAHIYDHSSKIVGTGCTKMEVIHPKPGWVEIDPDVLWAKVQEVIKIALKDAYISATALSCMGITVQRNTFITWDKDTSLPFHNFITWQDLRASDYVKEFNRSYSLWFLNKGGRLVHFFTRQSRYLAAAVLRFKSGLAVLRLKWQIDHDEKLRKRVEEKKVNFGCLETWLLWKMTKGEVFATDYSCASATGIYDPFQMEWSTIVSNLTKVPLHLFPSVKDTSGEFGMCSADIFDAPIRITAIIADQQAAMFGQCCFDVGDLKCTMGTGTFIDCNTGTKAHASIAGLYPLVGWKYGNETVYLAEGYSSDTGRCLEWAKAIGLYETVEETSDIAKSVPDSGGVYFVPAFSGLQAPINDDKACASLVGISPETTKVHILRAILESLTYRFKLLYDAVKKESKVPLTKIIKCDGGVCNNEFLVQLVSNLTESPMDRPQHMDMTSLGAAFLAGLATGVWKDKEELKLVRKTERRFMPQNASEYTEILIEWRNAMRRSMGWYHTVEI